MGLNEARDPLALAVRKQYNQPEVRVLNSTGRLEAMCIAAALFAAVIIGIYPPWILRAQVPLSGQYVEFEQRAYGWINNPPAPKQTRQRWSHADRLLRDQEIWRATIDTSILWVEWALVVIVGALAFCGIRILRPQDSCRAGTVTGGGEGGRRC